MTDPRVPAEPMRQPQPLPELSVVIVCLNALEALESTLASLAALTDWTPRVYVVDGASRDGTPAFLASCPYPLARWVSEPDRGIYDAMNKGWNMAADDSFILYLGAGDRLLSLPSRESVANEHRNGVDIILGNCEMAGSQIFHSMWYADLHLNNLAHHQTLLVHKSLCPTSPFDTTFKVYGDWEFNLRLYVQGKAARHFEEFRSFALPGGVSASHHLGEAFRIALRHGGLAKAVHALLRAAKAEARTRYTRWQDKHSSGLGVGAAP